MEFASIELKRICFAVSQLRLFAQALHLFAALCGVQKRHLRCTMEGQRCNEGGVQHLNACVVESNISMQLCSAHLHVTIHHKTEGKTGMTEDLYKLIVDCPKVRRLLEQVQPNCQHCQLSAQELALRATK